MRRFERVEMYKNDTTIQLPQRQTYNAAAYDFQAAENMIIPSLFQQVREHISRVEPPAIQPYLVKTGVKAIFPSDEALFIANRSGGPKRGLVLANAIGE